MGTVESMYLVRLARDRSDAGRKAFADALSDLFVADGGGLGQSERALMYEILHRVVRDIERAMRAEVSRQLALQPDVPRDLARALANDEIEVAYPILTLSTVLLDEDLIDVARGRTIEHQLAIAGRPDVSEAVSEALVGLGGESVITTLLRNPNARIAGATLEYLVEESKRVNAFQEPILRRADLPKSLAERMVFWVSAALRQYILDNFDIGEGAVDDALEATAFDVIRSAPARQRRSSELAAALGEDGVLSPDLLVSALREGEMRLFVALFERMTGLGERLVMDLVREPGAEGLAIACKASGIGKAYFVAIFALIRRLRPGSERQIRHELRDIMNLYDRMEADSAREIAQRWRRNIGYLAAIRDLKVG